MRGLLARKSISAADSMSRETRMSRGAGERRGQGMQCFEWQPAEYKGWKSCFVRPDPHSEPFVLCYIHVAFLEVDPVRIPYQLNPARTRLPWGRPKAKWSGVVSLPSEPTEWRGLPQAFILS